ncbi:MAG: ribonuclease III [Tannerellaceae bacterium]|nr:ribonuclease III [Tannerellaceae bacterium]
MSIYKITGYYPDNIELYKQSLSHRSAPVMMDDGRWLNNERMEFLGDAILNSIVADILYKRYPNKQEGFLTTTRSKIVQRETLNQIAVELGIDRIVRYATPNIHRHCYIFGNAMEALLAALYLDHGYRCCFNFVNDVIVERYLILEKITKKEYNFKSLLIEWCQRNKLNITFNLIDTYFDADRTPVFQTEICMGEKQIGTGAGFTKKESQQNAAEAAISAIRTDAEIRQYISVLRKEKDRGDVDEREYARLPLKKKESIEAVTTTDDSEIIDQT